MNRSFRSAALLTAGLAAACGDAPTEPAALHVAEHARVVLGVPVPLPTLTEAELMDAVDFAVILADLETWLDAAERRLVDESAPAADLAKLEAGRLALRQAGRLDRAGDREAAVALLRQAETRLVEATARALTALEIRAAEQAAAAAALCEEAGERDELSLRRGRRLLAHAREAQAEGDYERAVQRAHYAEVLLAGGCGDANRPEGVKR